VYVKEEVFIDVLVYRLLSGDQDLFKPLLKSIQPLKTIIEWTKQDDSEYYKVLGIVIEYAEKFKQLPPNKRALVDFANTSERHEIRVGWADILVAALKALNDIDESRLKAITDFNVLIDNVIKKAEQEHYLEVLDSAAYIVKAGPTKQEGKKKDLSGTADAKAYLLKALMSDVYSQTEIASGWLDEHIDLVAESLDKRLTVESADNRLKTLMPHIDQCVVVGPQHLSFIGIAGMSGDGKTTLENTWVYNWLSQGYNGLYVTFEHTPLEIWEFMAFLHATHEDYVDLDIKLPSLADWDLATDEDSGVFISDEVRAHVAEILRDMKSHRNFPGRLDVKTGGEIPSFAHLISYLEAFGKEADYKFVVVDYLARMTTGDPRYADQEIKNNIHLAQKLTRNHLNGRGIVFVTPMQVNREANKAARKAADKEETAGQENSTFYDINAIANFSEYQHDMDLIFSVYSDEKMKGRNELILQNLKKRKGKRPPMALMEISAGSGKVVEKLAGAPTTVTKEKFLTDDEIPAGTEPADNIIDEALI